MSQKAIHEKMNSESQNLLDQNKGNVDQFDILNSPSKAIQDFEDDPQDSAK